MNDIRGGRVTSYLDDIRHSAVAEFRGGQVPGSNKLGQRTAKLHQAIFNQSNNVTGVKRTIRQGHVRRALTFTAPPVALSHLNS